VKRGEEDSRKQGGLCARCKARKNPNTSQKIKGKTLALSGEKNGCTNTHQNQPYTPEKKKNHFSEIIVPEREDYAAVSRPKKKNDDMADIQRLSERLLTKGGGSQRRERA